MDCAILGVAARFGGSETLADFWQSLVEGRTLMKPMSEERYKLSNDSAKFQWGDRSETMGMFFDKVDTFDRELFGLSLPMAMYADPRQRMILETCWEVLEDAGYRASDLSGKKVGVFIAHDGWFLDSYVDRIPEEHLSNQEFIVPGNDPCFLANRISFYFDFAGPSSVFDTTCSGSFVALDAGCKALDAGDCDFAIVGGVSLFLNPWNSGKSHATPFETIDKEVRSFSNNASGYRTSEGCAALLLQRRTEDTERTHSVYGLVKSTATNTGGRTESFAQPSQTQQANLYNYVLQRAQVNAANINYLEAHGVASQLGDATEASALMSVFGSETREEQCYVSTLKPNIGHNHASSGIYAIIKVLLAMKNEKIPGIRNLKSDALNDVITASKNGLVFLENSVDWKSNGKSPRRALLSSYGFSNVNAAVVLQEPTEPMETCGSEAAVHTDSEIERIICLSANSHSQLQEMAQNLTDELRSSSEEKPLSLNDVAWTLCTGRELMKHRWATVVGSIGQLVCDLESFLADSQNEQNTFFLGKKENSRILELLSDSSSELFQLIERKYHEGNLKKIAELWVVGIEIDWVKCWLGKEGRKIRLPKYPFSQTTYWLPTVKDQNSRKKGQTDYIHPFVHRNSSDFQEQRFSTVFDGEEFCLKGHVIHDIRVLPGVGHLELARAAAHHSFGTERRNPAKQHGQLGLAIKNVVWAEIIGVVGDPQLVHIRFVPGENDDYLYQLYSNKEGEVTHNWGAVEQKELLAAPKIDVEKLRQKYIHFQYSPKKYYDMYNSLGLYMAPDYQGIQELYLGTDHVLARLDLPSSLESTRGDFVLHPCLMDGALLSSVALLMKFRDLSLPIPPKCLIPFALDEIEFYDETSDLCWAWISYSAGCSALDPFPKVDVDCCDENGQVCIRFKGFSCRGFGDPSQPDQSQIPWIVSSRLKPCSADATRNSLDYSTCTTIVCEVKGVSSDFSMAGVKNWETLVVPELSGSDERRKHHNVETIVQTMQAAADASEFDRQLVQIVLPETKLNSMYCAIASVAKSLNLAYPNLVAQVLYIDEEGLSVERLVAESNDPRYYEVVVQRDDRFYPSWGNGVSLDLGIQFKLHWESNGTYVLVGGSSGIHSSIAKNILEHAAESTVAILDLNPDGSANVDIRHSDASATQQVDLMIGDEVSGFLADLDRNTDGISGVVYCVEQQSALSSIDPNLDFLKAAETHETVLENLAGALTRLQLGFFATISSRDGELGLSEDPEYAACCAMASEYHQILASKFNFVRKPQFFSLVVPPMAALSSKGRDYIREISTVALYQAVRDQLEGKLMLLEGGDLERYRIELFGVRPCYADHVEARILERYEGDNADVVASKVTVDGHEDELLQGVAVDILKQVISGFTGVPEGDLLEDALLEQYGIDSMLSIKMTEGLEQHFGMLPKTLFFEYLSIHELSKYFVANFYTVLNDRLPAKPKLKSQSVKEAVVQQSSPLSSRLTSKNPSRGETRVVPRLAEMRQTQKRNTVLSGPDRGIAVVGLSGRYPKARTIDGLWENLLSERDCIVEIPQDRWNNAAFFSTDADEKGVSYGRWGGFVDGFDEFDPLFFNLSPLDARLMSPQERLFLQSAYEVLEDGGYAHKKLGARNRSLLPSKVGVYVGVMYGEYEFHTVEEYARGRVLDQSVVTGSFGSIANRVSHFFDFSGPSLAVDTMCSSSLTSIYLACQDLTSGTCEMAIAGGVNLTVHPNKYLILSQSKFLSKQGKCEAFGKGGEGYVPAEGVGTVLLKPLDIAIADGDRIYGVIRGASVNHGGKTNGYTVPNPVAQAEAIESAIIKSGVNPRDIGYIEAHGTGTSLGDPIEVAGLSRAFRKYTDDNAFCALGSIKSNIGHCESAAGIAGLTKILLQLQHKKIVTSIHSRKLNTNVDFDASPFFVPQNASNWEAPIVDGGNQQLALPRVAGVSSFGAGGSNAHLIVEEFVGEETASIPRNPISQLPVVVPVSAKNKERLHAQIENLHRYIAKHTTEETGTWNIEEIAFTLQTGREEMEARTAFVVTSIPELLGYMANFLDGKGAEESYWAGTAKTLKGKSLQSDVEFPKNGDGRSRRHWEEVARGWVEGGSIDWFELYPDFQRSRRLLRTLPTYAFARDRYWIPKSTARTTPIQSELQPDAHDHRHRTQSTIVYSGEWKEKPVQDLRESNFPGRKKSVDLFVAGPITGLLLEELKSIELVDEVVAVVPGNSIEEELSNLLWQLARYVKQAGLYGNLSKNLVLLAPSDKYYYRALIGALRTIELEEGISTKLILDDASFNIEVETLSSRLKTETSTQLGSPLVRYTKNKTRLEWTPTEVALPSSSQEFDWGAQSDIVVITGGLGGLGMIFAKFLSERTGSKIVLLGRSSLDRVRQSRLNELSQSGVDFTYMQCNASVGSELSRVLDQVRSEYGDIVGVVHSAGVIRDGIVRNKCEETIQEVISSKVGVAINIDELTKTDNLKYFVMFSSLASLGNLGQMDYAVANAFLDNFAEFRSNKVVQGSRSGRTLSINWPLWKDGGMSVEQEVEQHMRERFGIEPLDSRTALNVFSQALGSRYSQLGVMKGDFHTIQRYLRSFSKSNARNSENQDIQTVSVSNRSCGQTVLAALASLTELDISKIELERRFGDYGINSVGLSKFSSRVARECGIDLQSAELLEYDTPAKLVAFIDSKKLVPISSNRELARTHIAPIERDDVVDPIEYASSEDLLSEKSLERKESLAIVGFDCCFPGALNAECYWDNILNKIVSIGNFDHTELVSRGIRIGTDRELESAGGRMKGSAFLEGVDEFDAEFWAVDDETARQMDPQQRLLMKCIWRCVESAGYDVEFLSTKNVGLFIAADSTEYKSMLKQTRDVGTLQSGLSLGMMVNQISHFFNFTGPSEVIDNACASVFVALKKAMHSIQVGESDVAIVAGVKIMADFMEFYVRDQGGILSKSGTMSPFDDSADGYIRGEGVGSVLLVSESWAKKNRDTIHALVRGIGVSHSGRNALSSMAPSVDGQARTIRMAYDEAQLDPVQIDYIEAHGSATKFNDASEIAAFKRMYSERSGKDSASDHRCAIGSVKGNIGHLEAASGIASLLKVVMALKHRTIPPMASFSHLPPSIVVDGSPLYFPSEGIAWNQPISGNGGPRRAALNSIGITGVNAHVILEEGPKEKLSRSALARTLETGYDLIIVSARSEDALREYLVRWKKLATTLAGTASAQLTDTGPPSLSDIAYSSQVGRAPMQYRAAFVVSSFDELSDELAHLLGNASLVVARELSHTGSKDNRFDSQDLTKHVFTRCLDDLVNIGQRWARGEDFDWRFFADPNGRYVDIPHYPFCTSHYWFSGVVNFDVGRDHRTQ